MVKYSLITKKQALALKELGFAEPVAYGIDYCGRTGKWMPINLNGSPYGGRWTSLPTVDEAIDWLRRKYNIIIYNKIERFVDPTDDTHKTVLFKYGVKRCDCNHLGWNGRIDLGTTRLAKNVYSLKREAITIALKYIKSQKK